MPNLGENHEKQSTCGVCRFSWHFICWLAMVLYKMAITCVGQAIFCFLYDLYDQISSHLANWQGQLLYR